MSLVDYCGTVAIGTVATLISNAQERQLASIFNTGSGTVFLGSGTAVTAANGYPVVAAEQHHWFGHSAIYGISASGTNLLSVHEVIG